MIESEERIESLENLLRKVLAKLERIERILQSINDPQALVAAELVAAFSLPAVKSIKAAATALAALRELRAPDEISRAVVKALSTCEPLTISEITRRVRGLRGRASRTVVRDRINKLLSKGIVTPYKSRKGGRTLYTLRECVEEKGP